MANSKYIKVTEKGTTTPKIVLATHKNFFISQGAKIEQPTDEEVWAAVPQERPAEAAARPAFNPGNSGAVDVAKLSAAVEDFKKKVETLKKENEELIASKSKEIEAAVKEAVKEKDAIIEELNDKLAAAETTITESEKVIEGLRKELESSAKAKAKVKPEAETEA